MANLAHLTEGEQEAVTRAREYLVYTEMAADAGADKWLYEGRYLARMVVELAEMVNAERAPRMRT